MNQVYIVKVNNLVYFGREKEVGGYPIDVMENASKEVLEEMGFEFCVKRIKIDKLETVKWIATGSLIIAALMRGLGIHTLDIVLSVAGGILWTGAAIVMKDKPLVTVNTAMILALVIGILFQSF